jgi:hypothetical protein
MGVPNPTTGAAVSEVERQAGFESHRPGQKSTGRSHRVRHFCC